MQVLHCTVNGYLNEFYFFFRADLTLIHLELVHNASRGLEGPQEASVQNNHYSYSTQHLQAKVDRNFI